MRWKDSGLRYYCGILKGIIIWTVSHFSRCNWLALWLRSSSLSNTNCFRMSSHRICDRVLARKKRIKQWQTKSWKTPEQLKLAKSNFSFSQGPRQIPTFQSQRGCRSNTGICCSSPSSGQSGKVNFKLWTLWARAGAQKTIFQMQLPMPKNSSAIRKIVPILNLARTKCLGDQKIHCIHLSLEIAVSKWSTDHVLKTMNSELWTVNSGWVSQQRMNSEQWLGMNMPMLDTKWTKPWLLQKSLPLCPPTLAWQKQMATKPNNIQMKHNLFHPFATIVVQSVQN